MLGFVRISDNCACFAGRRRDEEFCEVVDDE